MIVFPPCIADRWFVIDASETESRTASWHRLAHISRVTRNDIAPFASAARIAL